MSGLDRLVGRIPGRPGLWELTLQGEWLERIRCRSESFADVHGDWITPGLFDLQVNGAVGISFADPGLTPEGAARVDEFLRAGGVSRYCPTVISRSPEDTRTLLRTLAGACEQGCIPGAWAIHLEGPWISDLDGPRGIHRREHVREASLEEWELLQQAAGGRVRLLTLAPECDGAIPLATLASGEGVVVSLGHTAASPTVIAEAVRAGASMSTHLFNGCAQLLDRHSNTVFAQLAEDALYACFIAEGHHVPFATLRIGIRTKGVARSILVSDLTHLRGLPDGEYWMEGNRVELRDGGLRVRGTPQLSGAARTLAEDVELLARQAEPGLEAALLMATRNPAAAMRDPQWADLRPGRRGPLAVFSWDGHRLALKQRIGF